MFLKSFPNYFRYLFPGQLINDVRNTIMPIGGLAGKKNFSARIIPEDKKIEKLVKDALPGRGSYGDLKESISGFFGDCAQTMMSYEKAVWEIAYLSEVEDETFVKFDFIFISPETIIRRRGKLIQYVPKKIAEELDCSQYIELIPENILIFELPGYVKKKFRNIMDSLVALSDIGMPDFYRQSIMSHKPKQTFYDPEKHIEKQKLALAYATRTIGWNARNWLKDDMLDFYYLHRRLLFEKFKIDLRNEILDTFNKGLEIAGEKLNFNAKLVIEGLPTLEDVYDAQAHLQSGDVPLGKILDPFSFY